MKQYLIGLTTGLIFSSFIFFFMGQTDYKMKSWEARPEKSNDEIFSLLKDIQIEIKDRINSEAAYVEYVTRGVKVDCD